MFSIPKKHLAIFTVRQLQLFIKIQEVQSHWTVFILITGICLFIATFNYIISMFCLFYWWKRVF